MVQEVSSRRSYHAPCPEETDGEAGNPGPGKFRARRRGPRSEDALMKRRLKSTNLYAQRNGEEEALVEGDTIDLLHVNMRGAATQWAEFTATLRSLPKNLA